MITEEIITKDLHTAGYDHVHVTEAGGTFTIHASPAQIDRKTGRYRLGDLLRGAGLIVTNHHIWIETEIATVTVKKG